MAAPSRSHSDLIQLEVDRQEDGKDSEAQCLRDTQRPVDATGRHGKKADTFDRRAHGINHDCKLGRERHLPHLPRNKTRWCCLQSRVYRQRFHDAIHRSIRQDLHAQALHLWFRKRQNRLSLADQTSRICRMSLQAAAACGALRLRLTDWSRANSARSGACIMKLLSTQPS